MIINKVFAFLVLGGHLLVLGETNFSGVVWFGAMIFKLPLIEGCNVSR